MSPKQRYPGEDVEGRLAYEEGEREAVAAIVKWLRDDKVGVGPTDCECWIADAIERGAWK